MRQRRLRCRIRVEFQSRQYGGAGSDSSNAPVSMLALQHTALAVAWPEAILGCSAVLSAFQTLVRRPSGLQRRNSLRRSDHQAACSDVSSDSAQIDLVSSVTVFTRDVARPVRVWPLRVKTDTPTDQPAETPERPAERVARE